ncbi:MAG: hypothetical protein R3F05_09220 [Planctomycetota bacterium]
MTAPHLAQASSPSPRTPGAPVRARRGRRALRAAAGSLALFAAACGGSGGGGGGPGGGAAPTASIDTVDGVLLVLPGDELTIAFTTNDDGIAIVRLLLDQDGMLATPGDQVLLLGPQGHSGGVQMNSTVAIPAGTPAGTYNLLLAVDDGFNPPTIDTHGTPVVVYPGLAGLAPGTGSNRYAVLGNLVWFSRSEAHDGFQAFNGDGADGDAVMARIDTASMAVTQGPVTVEKTSFAGDTAVVLPTEAATGVVAWTHLEADEGGDLDGDGVAIDRNLAVWPVLQALPTRNTAGGVISLLDVRGGRVLAMFSEAGQGPGGTNRTTGGLPADVDAADQVVGYLDPTIASSTDSALVFLRVAHAGGTVAVSTDNGLMAAVASEAATGGQDYTLDADAADNVPMLTTLAAGGGVAGGGTAGIIGVAGATNPLFAGRDVDPAARIAVASPGWIAYVINEGSYPGGDVNGDALAGGFALATYDNTTQTEYLLPPASAGANSPGAALKTLAFSNNRLIFTLQEQGRMEGTPGTNNDGDGGADLEILCWIDAFAGPIGVTKHVSVAGGTNMAGLTSLALDGGAIQEIAPGWFTLQVIEGANGNVDINGNGVVDDALLILEGDAAVEPVIHNPQLRATASVTIPVTGIGDVSGVVVRVLEALNGGDLDGDMNGTETLFAFIPFTAPSSPVFLDAGGDHAAVRANLIGVTANEALTGEDYDGNGQATDFVFRMFSSTGAVVVPGLLSNSRSVPATDDGTLWAFLRDEVAEGRDLNGDADVADLVLGLARP